jgi:hypothetical protein
MNRIIVSIALASLAVAALAARKAKSEFVARGEVLAVSPGDRTLTLEDVADIDAKASDNGMQSGVSRVFAIDDETKLIRDGEPIELADIAVGSFATVRYVMDSGRNIALSVEAGSPTSD